jgi:hypothetical protein
MNYEINHSVASPGQQHLQIWDNKDNVANRVMGQRMNRLAEDPHQLVLTTTAPYSAGDETLHRSFQVVPAEG